MCHPFHQILDGSGRSDRAGDTGGDPNANLPAMQTRRGWLSTAAAAAAATYAALTGRSSLFAQEASPNRQGGAARPRVYRGNGSSGSGEPPAGGTFTTQALGEEGGSYSPPYSGPVTTRALGEEGGYGSPGYGPVTTQAIGEEGGSYPPPSDGPITTQALGEEGGGYNPPHDGPPTTLALGEEGGVPNPGPNQPTTLALGEEGGSYYPPYRPSLPPRSRVYSPQYWRPFWRRNSR